MINVYYNDNDKHCCDWLRNLIEADLIAKGFVDERSIEDVTELEDFDSVHLFAGIGGWEYALSLAGWPSNLKVLTGSCPCQPFSIMGKKKGTEDERHLWPEMLRIIKESGIDFVFGEQVASPDGRDWLAGVQTDLEALGYTFGASDLCAAGIGAPHPRQRLYWVAYTESKRRHGRQDTSWERRRCGIEDGSLDCGMGESYSNGRKAGNTALPPTRHRNISISTGFWDDAEYVACQDSKRGILYRRIEPGLQLLVDGISFQLANSRSREDASRGQIIAGIGNSIVPELAAMFIRAFMESVGIDAQRLQNEQ